MLKKRLIAVLICRDGQIVQSVKFKHTNVIHYDPIHAVEAFNSWSVDEIILLNVSKDKSSRNEYINILKRLSEICSVPLTVGGWITDEDYAHELLLNGADKIVVNTIVNENTELVKKLCKKYGSQCIVGSIDYILIDNEYKVVVNRGNDIVECNPCDWAIQCENLGIGELIINCIDNDGARKGYNLEVLNKICQIVNIPVIAFGGVFTWDHLLEGFNNGADAVAVANQFHYTELATKKAKLYLKKNNIRIRKEGVL